jgi:hypothetical protein
MKNEKGENGEYPDMNNFIGPQPVPECAELWNILSGHTGKNQNDNSPDKGRPKLPDQCVEDYNPMEFL